MKVVGKKSNITGLYEVHGILKSGQTKLLAQTANKADFDALKAYGTQQKQAFKNRKLKGQSWKPVRSTTPLSAPNQTLTGTIVPGQSKDAMIQVFSVGARKQHIPLDQGWF